MSKIETLGAVRPKMVSGVTSRIEMSEGRLLVAGTPGTITGTTIGTGDGPVRQSHVWIPYDGILRGFYIPQVIEPAADTVRFNLSLWTQAMDSVDLEAGVMVDSGAWGVATLDQTGANVQGEPCAFQNDVAVIGGRWYYIIAFINVGAGATAAQFRNNTIVRPDQDGGGVGRFDGHSTATQAFPTGTPAALLSGLSYTEASDVGEKINYGLWWR